MDAMGEKDTDTRRLEAGDVRQLFRIVGTLGLAIVVLAYVAVFLGEPDLAEKIFAVGLYGTIVGLWLVRASKRLKAGNSAGGGESQAALEEHEERAGPSDQTR